MDFSSNVPDLSQLSHMANIKKKKEELFGYDVTDIAPTEITAIKELMVWCRRELANYYNSVKSLNSWAMMVDHKFAEIGWSVFVDPFEVELDTKGNPILCPIINLTGRMAETEFDFEQAKHETQHGLLDGIVGKVDEKGIWKDPDLKL